MTETERQIGRAALVNNLDLDGLVDTLEGKNYGDLIDRHVREVGSLLSATISVHEDLVTPEESSGVMDVLKNMDHYVSIPGFWPIDAAKVFTAVSCHLNDSLFPKSAEVVGVFNLFQLITLKLAERAYNDETFYRKVLSRSAIRPSSSANSGSITKMLGIAINDCDAGRITKKQLLEIFQDAIDNGDILEPDNEHDVVSIILPLVNRGLLRSSPHLKTFEDRMRQ
jgi:hypothetical protein